jgi:peroxiredoxin Q/BCP
MSKKTRKKSSKTTLKAGSTKTKTAKRVTARASAASTTGKSVKKTQAKQPAAKSPATKGTAARTTKEALRKTDNPASKPVTSPVRKAEILSEGQQAPAFSLPRDGGQHVSLANYAGRKLVIFFYPRADTPGCTLEAIAFSRLASAFASAQTAILGVSADPVTAQERFRDKHELTVPLVSDEKLGMLKAYGVWGEKSMYGKTFMGIARTTVLLDADGKVAKIWRNVRVDGHADEVLTAARTT